MSTTKCAFRLQEVRDKILNNEWVTYSSENDGAGTLWMWGPVGYGNNTSNITFSSPIQVPGTWLNIYATGNSTEVLLYRCANGTMYTTNSGASYGQTGLNGNIPYSSPTQIPGTTWRHVGVSGNMVLATKTDNTLWVWGRNNYGQLGQNDTVCRSSPIQIPGTSWCFVGQTSFNGTPVAAIKSDNTLWVWGDNNSGILGINLDSSQRRSSPVQIPGTNWVDFSTQKFRKSDNTLWHTGSMDSSGLNLPPYTTYRSSPVQLPGSWCTPGGTTNQAGNHAVKTDGTLWWWGQTYFGSSGIDTLGFGTASYRSSPTQIPGTTWCDVWNGRKAVRALKTDNTLWTWGYNQGGSLGLNNTQAFATICQNARSSPVQLPGTWTKLGRGFRNGGAAIKG